MLTHRDASHVFDDLLGGATPVASDPTLAMVPCRSRLLAANVISPAAALRLKARLCLGCVPRQAHMSTRRRR
jgi:hypothetical protein